MIFILFYFFVLVSSRRKTSQGPSRQSRHEFHPQVPFYAFSVGTVTTFDDHSKFINVINGELRKCNFQQECTTSNRCSETWQTLVCFGIAPSLWTCSLKSFLFLHSNFFPIAETRSCSFSNIGRNSASAQHVRYVTGYHIWELKTTEKSRAEEFETAQSLHNRRNAFTQLEVQKPPLMNWNRNMHRKLMDLEDIQGHSGPHELCVRD